MPHPDENQVSPAADTFPRRLCAVIVDLLLVGLPALLMAVVGSERFSVVGEDGGRTQFSVADQLRINEIDEGLNRAVRLGDTVFTLSGGGLVLTLLTLVVLTALVFFVVPALQQGQTPGRSLLRLPVLLGDNTDVEVLGVAVRETTEADSTRAVEEILTTGSTGGRTSPDEEPAPTVDRSVGDRSVGDTTAAVDDTLAGLGRAEVIPSIRALDDPGLDNPVGDNPVRDNSMRDDPGLDNPMRNNPVPDSPVGGASAVADARSAPLGGMEYPAVDQPSIDHQTTNGPLELDTTIELGIRDETASAVEELRQLLQADLTGGGTTQVTLGDDLDYEAFHRMEDDRADGAGPVRGSQDPDASGEDTFDTLTLPESSLSETPLTVTTDRAAEVPHGAPAATTTSVDAMGQADADPAPGSDPEPNPGPASAITPAWNDDLQAWVYRDETSGRLFRHDETSGRWVPAD
ncbi:MAG: RDD family protein [Actinomycetota bacterium]